MANVSIARNLPLTDGRSEVNLYPMTTLNPSASSVAAPRSRRRAALGAAYLGTFLATLDISIVNVALPTLQTALSTDIAGLQWVVNAYAICLSALMLSAGPIGDRYGHKRAWMAGVALFTLGSALCAVSASLTLFLIGRAVQGVAAALLIPGAMTILTHAFTDPRERAHAIGGWSAFTALALILGPLLGGLLLHSAGWQSIFLINLPLGFIALGLGAWGITEHRYPEQAALDPLGQSLSIVCLGALTYGMIEAGRTGFLSAFSMIPLAVSLVAMIAFVIVEMRVKRPLLPIWLFKNRAFAIANFASFALGFSYYGSLFFFSIFLQQIQQWSPSEAGWRMMPQFVVTGGVSMLFGRLSTLMGVRRLMVAGYGLVALSMSTMVLLSAQTPYWLVGTLFALLGLGAGLAVPGTGIAVMNAVPAERSGAASATMNALRQAGMTIGIALLGTLLSNQAVSFLTRAAHENGIRDGARVAHQAVTQHLFPGDLPVISDLYVAAMEHGFHSAMLAAGGMCFLAMVLLLMDRHG
ncbi:DHA2 family efflux MFS transporter permease subunit [Alloalcanivorax gelatiniphagus]|nr:DHA2 family efflux MFS transporter permease subunit [Alloalcanivorax gelatiniphagus]